jgi:prepilin-type N-terminal cleavage/methylation domain-containing protein
MRKIRKATKILKHKAGFTLLELIVAVGLFTIAIFISFGALVGLFDANGKSQTIFSAMTNLNYAIEGMTRDIRFATTYHCDITNGTLTNAKDCDALTSPYGADSIAITSGAITTIYRFNGTRIEKKVGTGSYVPVTGSDVSLQYVRFYVYGSEASKSQSLVAIVMKGNSGTKPSTQTNFDLETIVSKKQLDL